MLYSLLSILLQPEVSGGPPVAPAPGGGGAPAPGPMGCGGGGVEQIGFLVLMFAVLYFLMIRPQQKRAKQHDAMMGALKKGDVVRTNGGIRGEITALDEPGCTMLRGPLKRRRFYSMPPSRSTQRNCGFMLHTRDPQLVGV